MDGAADDTPLTAKSPGTAALLLSALRELYLFAHLEQRELKACVDRMSRHEYPAGADIITQGDSGSEFFVLETGAVQVVVDGGIKGEFGPSARYEPGV